MSASVDMSDFNKRLAAAGEATIARAKRALDEFGLHTLGNAQDLCPVLTGALQQSATDRPAEFEGGKLTKLIGFNTNYAAAVHEGVGRNFRQGQAKFLETAIREARPQLAAFVAAAIKEGNG